MMHTDEQAAATRPMRKDAARNRALLLAAARDVFAERGLEASLDDIAHRAGVGVGTAYRHFANKYELAQAIFADAVDRIVDLAERAQALDDPWQGIVSFLEGTGEAQTADRGLREVLMGMHVDEQMQQINERLRQPLTDLVDRAREAGALPDEITPTDLGVLVIMLGTVADVTGDLAPDLWRRYLPILLAGLRSGAPLPIAALSPEDLQAAMASHKQRLLRAGQAAAR